MDLDTLSSPELTPLREQAIEALGEVSARPDAASVLKVSANLTAEIARNVELRTAPALPAGELYSGVLYDALDLPSLETAARRRANRWVAVQSALYGALRLTDRVAPYRLSMGVNLPGVGPLAGYWRPALNTVMPTLARGVIVDCRSSTYAAAWSPQGALADRWVQVNVLGATHMAKHTRGLVARHLCLAGVDAKQPEALHSVVSGAFSTDLEEPSRSGQPWRLTVQYV